MTKAKTTKPSHKKKTTTTAAATATTATTTRKVKTVEAKSHQNPQQFSMKIMADLEAVNLGMDENEADIAEELQDFDESFDTRSEASDSGSESSGSDSEPSISSVSTTPSSINLEDRKRKSSKSKTTKENEKHKKSVTTTKRRIESTSLAQNGKTSSNKKKKVSSSTSKTGGSAAKSTSKSGEGTKKSSSDNATAKKSRKKTSSSNAGGMSCNNSSSVAGNVAMAPSNGENASDAVTDAASTANFSAKSDESEAEDRATVVPPPPTFESDSESVDSDAAANVKRNGRKAISKSVSPEKKISGSGLSSSGGGGSSKNKSYDYMTKINYLFRDTRFFLIKSNNADNIALSKSKSVWATLPQNDANLNQAFKEARNVLLIFSVNESGKFAGFARMSAPSSRDIPQIAWVLPPSISPKALGGVIELDWICRKELSFNCTSHLYNSWNEGKPVKIGRDGQEIEPKVGAELCRLFPEDEKIELTPILRKSKETAKMMREKGIRVVYKPPRSLSARGSRSGSIGGGGGYRNGGGSGGGPIRHKRSYGGGGPHRPYKIPPMGPPPSGFKRGSSPYRSGSGGPGGLINSRAGGGDSILPPWERYINSAAAEAYVADYMRTMHGQLPPLPFVPFGQLPLQTAGAGAGLPPPGATPYEQLPPPVRYYDGPPLPDYPPPQAIRPPPPGFDKPPSYEDFAAWKNAGLPTVPPPGFPSISATNGSASGSTGSSGGAGSFQNSGGGGSASSGGPTHSSYRNNRDSANNMNRSRERGGGPGPRDYRSGGERERHFRGGERGGGHRAYRDSRR